MSKLTEQYLGKHMKPLELKKDRKKHYTHPIFLFTPEDDLEAEDIEKLSQTVNVYEHSIYDFEFNSRKIIKHFKKYYGADNAIFTLGQGIKFRVYKGQDPIDLSLFAFLMNYTMIIPLIILGADMHHWKSFLPNHWTTDLWDEKMDEYIRIVRPLGNSREICECIEWSKYLMNLFCAEAGDRLGLSISNNDFLEVAKRNKDAYESLTCSFDIPEDCSPSDLEKINKKRTTQLINIISDQSDLPISVYTRNGLFNPGQFREFGVHMGYKPDLYDHTIPMTYPTNIIMGLKHPVSFMVDAFGGRKAEVLKLNVSNAGAFERALCMLMSNVRYVDIDYECDSQHFRVHDIDSLNTLKKLEGRVAKLDLNKDEYRIVDPKDEFLVGKRLYLKTPITCTHPRRHEGYICSACYGKLMANLNCDVHIGRLAGLNNADDVEQKLLSAKHQLATDTNDVEFDPIFNTYFELGSCQIGISNNMVQESVDDPEAFKDLFLEFHFGTMFKKQDGEGRHFDRGTTELVVYNKAENTHTIIAEKNEIPIYLAPELVMEFLDAAKHHNPEDPILIPFEKLVDNGKILIDVLFEYQYVNNGIAKPLDELQGIMTKTSRINEYKSYDECLNALIPLFNAAGIHLPEFQQELLVSQLVIGTDGKPVDWTLEHPDYMFQTIDKAIQNNPSALTSILYHESSRQLAGAYDTYKKTGTSAYDWFILDPKLNN